MTNVVLRSISVWHTTGLLGNLSILAPPPPNGFIYLCLTINDYLFIHFDSPYSALKLDLILREIDPTDNDARGLGTRQFYGRHMDV